MEPNPTFENYFVACAQGNVEALTQCLNTLQAENWEIRPLQKDGWIMACCLECVASIDYFLFNPLTNYAHNPHILYQGLAQCIEENRVSAFQYVLERVWAETEKNAIFLENTAANTKTNYDYPELCFKLLYYACATVQENPVVLEWFLPYLDKRLHTHFNKEFNILQDTNYDPFIQAWDHQNVAALSLLVRHYQLTGKEPGFSTLLEQKFREDQPWQEHIAQLMRVNIEKPFLENNFLPQAATKSPLKTTLKI